MVERVEIYVRQQRTDHCSLRGSRFGRAPFLRAFHDALSQELLQQAQNAAVRYLCLHQNHQLVLRYVVEVSFDVGIHHPCVSCSEQLLHTVHGLPGTASRSKAITVLMEAVFEDGFYHIKQCGLHNAVSDGGYAQWPLVAASRFFDPHPAHGFGFISAFAQ